MNILKGNEISQFLEDSGKHFNAIMPMKVASAWEIYYISLSPQSARTATTIGGFQAKPWFCHKKQLGTGVQPKVWNSFATAIYYSHPNPFGNLPCSVNQTKHHLVCQPTWSTYAKCLLSAQQQQHKHNLWERSRNNLWTLTFQVIEAVTFSSPNWRSQITVPKKSPAELWGWSTIV